MSAAPDPDAPAPFGLLAEIPPGVTVLEASAGTGKTYTIAALATRFVAEGTPLAEMLLVTFTRMATGELRERVRQRLIASERRLGAALVGIAAPDADALDAALAAGTSAEVARRRERLIRALSDFDAATIETTHSFCQQMLAELGTLADADPDATLTEHADEVLTELVDDLYVRRHLRDPTPPVMSRAQALEIARAAVANPDAILVPHTEPDGPAAATRWRLATAVRRDLDLRKRSLRIITYDDLLRRLYGTLTGVNGEAAVAQLRRRFGLVLIDEFQDTDPIQWNIVKRAFGDGERRLVLIADPKQAIYAFRGADVFAYLNAARSAAVRATLAVNYRSDSRLLAGLDGLFGGLRLGHPDIAYRRVAASPEHRHSRLLDAPRPGALRVRVLDRRHVALTRTGCAQTPAARDAVAADVAADIVELLGSAASIRDDAEAGSERGRPIDPGDIAVLVDKHRNAASIQRALEAAGVPVVIAGAGSVFLTPAARDWRAVLEALERPSSSVRANTAALGPLIGWTPDRLADAGQSELEILHGSLYRWSRLFVESGTATMIGALMTDTAATARLLRHPGGERRLTDLTHVGELLHRAAAEQGLGLSALTAWLRERIAAAEREGAHGDERTRRLDSDAAAVQVLTIHRAKGLEWPIVYCPFLWDRGWQGKEDRPVRFHRDGERALDVTLEGPAYRNHRTAQLREERGEDLRLAYVALTRARHAAIVHWAGSWDARNAPLTRMRFNAGPDGSVATEGTRLPSDSEVHADFTAMGASCADATAVSVEWCGVPHLGAHWSPPHGASETLERARLGRGLELRWRRTSYSALTAPAHDPLVGSEPEAGSLEDEPAPGAEGPAELEGSPGDGGADGTNGAEGANDGTGRVELPLASMAFGTAVGTAIHRALDLTDFAAPALVPELAVRIVEATGSRGVGLLGCPVAQVASGLAVALETPIPGLGGLRLAGVVRADRLDELAFELPLAGGDGPGPASVATLAHLADVLEAHLEPGSSAGGYAERLRDPALAGALRGYLTGSIDLVIRHRGADGTTRYGVVDYKTNWLAPAGVELALGHYRTAVLAGEMQKSHYLLQGLLYSVALHRFLRWRLPDYAPAVHLDGLHYLFLRGMVGAQGAGVFSWRPPAGLVPALSDLLDGGPA